MVTEQILFSFGWAPWSSIIAGSITALAVSVILAILGVALGFTVISPKSDDPTSGLGVAFGAWGGFSILLSTACGGFAAGLLAGQRGLEIGFLTWAVTTLGAMFFSGIAAGSAIRLIGAAMKNTGSGVVNAATGLGKGAFHAASNVAAELKDNIHFNLDTEKINDNAMGVLRDTGIPTLQPEYLRDRLNDAKTGLRGLVHELALNPADWEKSIGAYLNKVKKCLASMTGEIDRDTAVNALMKTRNLPQDEAEKLVDNAVGAYRKVLEKTEDSVTEARNQVMEAKEQIKWLTDQAREKAEELSRAAAKASLAAALALILAAGISMGAGHLGSRYASTWVAVGGQVQNTALAR